MSAIGMADIEDLIGVQQYEEEGEFPVEQGYVWTTCSSVENGNPIFWDEPVADAVTGGPSRRRPWSRCGSAPTTGRPDVPPRACLSRSTSTSRRDSGCPRR